jgi:hypothetical protein
VQGQAHENLAVNVQPVADDDVVDDDVKPASKKERARSASLR